MLKAVLDTSIFVSTLLVRDGVPAQVLKAWRAQRYALVISPPIIDEIRHTLAYPRLRKKERFTDAEVDALVESLERDGSLVAGFAELSDVDLRDPNDAIILATAANGWADVIVSSDQDLLVLGSFRGIEILTARQFLDRLNET